MPQTHPRLRRQPLDVEAVAKMRAHPRHKLAERAIASLRQRHELRLSARAAVVNDQLLRHAPRQRLAMVLRDHGQRHVDARRHAR